MDGTWGHVSMADSIDGQPVGLLIGRASVIRFVSVALGPHITAASGPTLPDPTRQTEPELHPIQTGSGRADDRMNGCGWSWLLGQPVRRRGRRFLSVLPIATAKALT